jgi:tetratricopeptide (TPR) repeat protein
VALHLCLGLGVAIAAFPLLQPRFQGLSGSLRTGIAILAVGAVPGIVLMVTGATRPHRSIVLLHVALMVLGSLLVLAELFRAAGRLVPTEGRALGQLAVSVAAFATLLSVFAVVKDRREAAFRDRIVNPATAPATMDGEGAGPKNPFFPSSAETNVGGIIPANFFLTSSTCAHCHPDVYAQWNSSAHHFSSFNNQWYRKSIEYMQDTIGTKPSKWCAGCHDHAVFFNGRFDRPIKEQIDTVEAQAGLACTSCHSIVHVKSTMGQGDFEIEYPPLHDLAVSQNPVLAWTHDYLLRLAPRPHRETFLKNFHRQQTPEFCSSCHKVHLDVPVNNYRWFRGFNDYDNWQASGISGEGARSFYYPPKSQKCADCHMPMVEATDPAAIGGKIHSHRFAAANTALPFVNGDHEQLRITQAFLQDKQVSVDVFGLVRGEAEAPPQGRAATGEPRLASTFAQGEEAGNLGAAQTFLTKPVEVVGPLDKVGPALRRGESARVDVVVRTRRVGHFFPGGTVDAFDVWVELEAVDEHGRTVFHSGGVLDDGKGPVEAGAHFYRSLLLDEHGNPINKRNAWAARSVAYVRLIPPGAADTIHYRIRVPEDCGDKITLRAKVNYRKFSWWNTQWAFAGVRDPSDPSPSVSADHDDGRWLFTGDTSHVSGNMKAIPAIPITVMAQAETSLTVLPKGAPVPPDKTVLDKSVRERWNDYGIGLLLQGDIKAAEATFLKVTEMDPGYADGWVNVARTRITEGNLAGAQEYLEKALERDETLAKTHFFLGTVLKGLGKYDDALQQLNRAAQQYPRDRVVLDQIGRTLFLKRQYAEAIEAFRRVLLVDPEDLQAHYNLMLCWQGLAKPEEAHREQVLYERFKVDEASQFITGPYRRLHPEDNNERQSIHEHVSVALGASAKSAYPPAKRVATVAPKSKPTVNGGASQ